MNVPIVELQTQYRDLKNAIDAAVAEVLDAGWYVLGAQGRAFEVAWAAYLDMPHAVGVGSGTDALQLALVALGIGPGDAVITTPLTAAPTAMAIRAAGATPVFADVDPDTLTLDPQAVQEHITPRTRAILPVHLYGHPADLDGLIALCGRHDLRLIEDCAQAHGTRYKGRLVGTFGDAAAFSFYPSKNLGAFGDAGAVVCRDADLAERVRMLRNYGESPSQRYHHQIEGFNSRLDEIQAAVLRAKLPHLDAWNERRRAIAAHYRRRISHPAIRLPAEQPWGHHVYHLFVARCEGATSKDRDALRAHLSRHNIGTQVHYPFALHRQPAFAHLNQGPGACPVAERLAGQILSLPMYPEMSDAQIEHVAVAVNAFVPATAGA